MTPQTNLTRAFLAVLLVVLACAAPVSAAEQKGIFDLPARWDLSIYTLIVFTLLLFFLGKFAWPNIVAGMKAREEGIAKLKDDAIKALEAASVKQTELDAKLAAANDEIRKMLDEARRDAIALREAEKQAGLKEAQQERERAKREIDTAKEQALQEIYQKSVQLAALMSSKAVRRQMTASDHERLIEESLAELKTNMTKA
jgi:F-type H+-transporting ATPase subunit b